MSNTYISPQAMLGVLQQLPRMSDKIVDDTRHEKVLSYMRLYLASPGAAHQLLAWDALGLLGACLQADSDYRVSSVAIRFAGDIIQCRDVWEALNCSHTHIVEWVVANVDSAHALVRIGCLQFVQQAAAMDTSRQLLERLDCPRLIMRRLLDPSCFVVAEACKLLGILISNGDGVDQELAELVERLVARPFEAQDTARKTAVLLAVEMLYAADSWTVALARTQFPVDRMALYLYDSDRLVRDKALDVLEAALGAGCVDVADVLAALDQQTREPQKQSALVALRCLAAIVKQTDDDARRLAIVQSAADFLQLATGGDGPSHQESDQAADLAGVGACVRALLYAQAPSSRATTIAVACESARIVREFCRRTLNADTVAAMCALLETRLVQSTAQLLQLILDAIIHALRQAHGNFAQLLVLPQLAGSFAIGAPGLKALYGVALEVIGSERDNTDPKYMRFLRDLRTAVRARLADVEWESRDTTLEFVASAAALDGRESLITAEVVDDVAAALGDAQEYVRASAAQALVALVGSCHAARVASHGSIDRHGLAALVGDSEAFVRRAATDLACAIGEWAISSRTPSAEWALCLGRPQLRQLADDPDFEVRVRCTQLLALLVGQVHIGPLVCANISEHLASLHADTLLLDMCRDTSRYVRGACLHSLRELKRQLDDMRGCPASGDGSPGRLPKRQATGRGQAFYERLCGVDWPALEASLSVENLYQEALDTQVESELMAELRDPNYGNNMLDCY
ncbi:hypothetical protein LPJ61_001141 [Coemansia biformis]|uniref:ARM repeat-containing protein n=1 Tax=Coemansia biformis TaxID=1286918 RepID=A0A9W7YAJ5_9FUNG|nr:hypothetical protein LPJ61_001141 [Coemansia biformis]